MPAKKKGLGRGLGSLISSGVSHKNTPQAATHTTNNATPNHAQPTTTGFYEIPIDKIDPNPYQPRREFEPASLQDLAESIRSEGLMQPIVVRKNEQRYEIIAGERRWRACQQLKLKTLPARVVEASNASTATMALIENLQRENLNPIEEAHGYASLLRDFDLTQEAVAERIGKARASIANALRLLALDSDTQAYIAKGLLSVGHAKVLLSLEDHYQRKVIVRQIIEKGISVRELERIVQNSKHHPTNKTTNNNNTPNTNAEANAVAHVQRQLESHLATRIHLKHGAKKGKIIIEYYGNDDLQRILERVGINI